MVKTEVCAVDWGIGKRYEAKLFVIIVCKNDVILKGFYVSIYLYVTSNLFNYTSKYSVLHLFSLIKKCFCSRCVNFVVFTTKTNTISSLLLTRQTSFLMSVTVKMRCINTDSTKTPRDNN